MRPLWVLLALVLCGCAGGPPSPATLDTSTEACRFCRMMVSNARFAGQIVAPREEPLFFDDLTCLASYLAGRARVAGAAIYVADHRTGRWIPAETAVYTEAKDTQTPMGGGIIAHADAASRDADPAGRGGTEVRWAELLAQATNGGAP